MYPRNEAGEATATAAGVKCAPGYTCSDDSNSDVVWVTKNDGNVNGPTCQEGGCWWPDAPAEGLYLVSIDTAEDGSKSCFFPTESSLSCSTHPGHANCFGERYASVCPCTPKPLDEACAWECGPDNTTRAVWKTSGTSCLERIN